MILSGSKSELMREQRRYILYGPRTVFVRQCEHREHLGLFVISFREIVVCRQWISRGGRELSWRLISWNGGSSPLYALSRDRISGIYRQYSLFFVTNIPRFGLPPSEIFSI